MKIVSRLIFTLALSGCIACYGGPGGSSSDSEELPVQALEQLTQTTNADRSLLSLSPLVAHDVACFVLNVKQGNCVFLRGPSGTVVVDAGTQISGLVDFSAGHQPSKKWDAFRERYSDVINYCFTGVPIVSFVITHLDIDHYLYVPFLAKFAVANGARGLNFFIGINIEYNIKEFTKHLCQLQIEPGRYQMFGHCTPTRRNKDNFFSVRDQMFPSWQRFAIAEDGIGREPWSLETIEGTLNKTLGSEHAHFHTLIPINGLKNPEKDNAESLVLLFEHQGSNILFTGDATGDTLEAILGNRYTMTQSVDAAVEQLFFKSSDMQAILNYSGFSPEIQEELRPLIDSLRIENDQQLTHTLAVSSISKRNRHLLSSVNLMMESHHGSDQEGCNAWLPMVKAMSGCNFCGSISSTDALQSMYGHPRHLTFSGVDFPPSARGLRKPVFTNTPSEIGWKIDRFTTKQANTKKNVFQTALVDVYQFLFTNDGMGINYHMHGEPMGGQLTSTGGLSVYSRNLWERFLKEVPLRACDLSYLHGAFSRDHSIFATKHIAPGHIRNTPALLTVRHSLRYDEDKQLLLANAHAFCSLFELNPVFVFGVSPDTLQEIGLEYSPEEPLSLTNYTPMDVPDDGDCGIAAVLCGLNPEQFFAEDPHDHILRLRHDAAELVPLEDDGSGLMQEQKTRIASGKRWLAIEDFQYIARVIERPILVITNVDGSWNWHRFELEGEGESGSGIIPDGRAGVEAILDANFEDNPGRLFVYHESRGDVIRHFQAIVHN
ncbi:MAG: hypothetical protein LBF43_02115 [Puniceicoccales bacterium]|jgi:hypothetical protein|nr:hypothetical protein [Puniceicoccales bacterium]